MTPSQTNQIKGIAIVFMLLLHLFNTYDFSEIYRPYILINDTPLTFYISLFADCCVVLFLFCSGYGLYYSYNKNSNRSIYLATLPKRVKELYVKYWIILLMLPVGMGLILSESNYPGDLTQFALNFSGLYTSYNGAWWFFTTYLFCLALSPIIFRFLEKSNVIFVLFSFFVLYTIGYIQRVKNIVEVDGVLLSWLIEEAALLGNSLLPFVCGAIFLKYDVFGVTCSFLASKLKKSTENLLLLIFLVSLFVLKTYLPSLFFAIFFGLGFVVIYICLDIPKFIQRLLTFLGEHSANIWLIHMFLYLHFTFFKPFVFFSKDPILIFLSLLLISLFISYLVNFLETKQSNFFSRLALKV